MSNYLELCQSVRAQAGISGNSTPANTENQIGILNDVVRWTAESYNEIQTLHENWNFLHNTYSLLLQPGFSSYNPELLVGDNGGVGVRTPTKDTFILESVSPKIRLKYIAWSVWQISDVMLREEIGSPEYYTEDPKGNFHFYPIEEPAADQIDNIDHTISFQGYARPQRLLKSTDIPILHPQYQELIKLGALKRYAEFYNSPEIMQSVVVTYDQQLNKLRYSELPRDNLITPSFVPFA